MSWKDNAINILKESLYPVPSELNELDWKSGLSCKTERLAQHISAFANNKGGGMLVYGVNDDGTIFSPTQEEMDQIIRKLGNIAKNNLSYAISIDHTIIEFEGESLLFVYIPEQKERPVHLKGKDVYESYCRSAKQTVKMSRQQVHNHIAESQGVSFENRIVKSELTVDEVLSLLNYSKLFELLDKNLPSSTDSIINKLLEYGCCERNGKHYEITNLGALLFANNFSDFPQLKGREVIVRKYQGTNNRNQLFEQHVQYGYAIGFAGLIDFIMSNVIDDENIEVTREYKFKYPKVAIREFVANAIVHQDFSVIGIPICVEIFTNRLVITNPGVPLNDVNRLIDLPPHSRNERLAETMFLLNMCERRGSGVDRAIEAIEKMQLPAVKISKNEDSTRVTLYPKKNLSEMTKGEKIDACYQHACLMNEDDKAINNKSVRERFGLDKNKSADASRIIADTLEQNLIKFANADVTSRKFATYKPYYA
ncbi:MAG: putative DNA binding domain-containing protein [Bacteroidaceae bacterium]|nr:putative DNA binding domain-containing protein [Bacteroidaceae bacterium]